MNLTLSPKKLLTVLTVIVVSLIAAHIVTQYLKFVAGHDTQLGLLLFFNLNVETCQAGTRHLPYCYARSS